MWICNMSHESCGIIQLQSSAFTECNQGCKRLQMTVQIGESFQDNYICMEWFIDLK